MMKKLFYSVLLLTLVYTVGYAREDYTENRSVGSFNMIDVCCGIDVYISEGASSTIRVETNKEEFLPRIITETKNGELRIYVNNKNNFFTSFKNVQIKVYVTASNLTGIKATSGSDVQSTGVLSANEIKLSASSGADINLDLNAVRMDCSVSSGSDIKLRGKASYASLNASSGSDMDLGDMTVGVVDASASSGSDIVVRVTDEIDAKASSGADIIYKGSPKIVNKKESSGGDVRQKS